MCAHKDSLRAQPHSQPTAPQGGPWRRDTLVLRPRADIRRVKWDGLFWPKPAERRPAALSLRAGIAAVRWLRRGAGSLNRTPKRKRTKASLGTDASLRFHPLAWLRSAGTGYPGDGAEAIDGLGKSASQPQLSTRIGAPSHDTVGTDLWTSHSAESEREPICFANAFIIDRAREPAHEHDAPAPFSG